MADRPTAPPSRGFLNELFPVDPRQVAGGLYSLGTQAIGQGVARAASQPFPGLAPNVSLPNSDQLGRDTTAMLDSPVHGGFNPDAALHATLAAAPLAVGARIAPEVDAVTAAARQGRAAAAASESAAPSINAYHGSPYKFDAFDASKIGTGEGAQAYGHGLYFADQEDTAKS